MAEQNLEAEASDDTPTPPGTTFAWAQAEKRLEAQMRQADSLDSKAGALLGFHGVVAGFFVAIAPKLQGLPRVLAALALGVLILSAISCVGALMVVGYDRIPSPKTIAKYALDDDEVQIQYRLLSTRLDALSRNATLLHRRAFMLRLSIVAFGLVVVLASSGGLAHLVGGG